MEDSAIHHSDTMENLTQLLPALQRLDGLLARAVTVAQAVYGQPAATDRFRGLYINNAQVAQAMARTPGVPIFAVDQQSGLPAVQLTEARETADTATTNKTRSFWRNWFGNTQSAAEGKESAKPPLVSPPDLTELPSLEQCPPFAWLQARYGLNEFELDVLLLAAGPVLDRRYELVYAYLQDNVGWRQPSVDLILNILCADAAEKIARRESFGSDSPLLKELLITLQDRQNTNSLLAKAIIPDNQIVRYMLADFSLDEEFVPFCDLESPLYTLSETALSDAEQAGLRTILQEQASSTLRIYLHGAAGVGKKELALAAAGELNQECLVIDCPKLMAQSADQTTMRRLAREIWLLECVPVFTHVEALFPEPLFEPFLQAVAEIPGLVLFTGRLSWPRMFEFSIDIFTLELSFPDHKKRAALWREYLLETDTLIEEATIWELASRYRMTSSQIQNAVFNAQQKAVWRTAVSPETEEPELNKRDLITAVHAQFNHDLSSMAQKIDPLYTWDDIVLPDGAREQLRQLCARVKYHHQVWQTWGFDKRLSQGKGINVLFAGPSGTGKTMAAEIIANELGYELYKIDLSGVVSKYIGETEKNLNQIFAAAENASAILFFDEADALFGKRSEVRDAHDRYANIEVSFLLQKMEMFDGLSILASNLRQHLDDAFIRRLTDTVHFPFPDEKSRVEIWHI
ncbi:MAG: ATP-binding protein, partial [Anaerolineae bacterium]